MNHDVERAAAERAAAVAQRTHRPAQRRWAADTASVRATAPLSANLHVIRAAAEPTDPPTLEGFGTVYEQPYQMWDAYGPYTEVVSAGAGETSLRTNPDVKYLFNHRGMPMASTRTQTLTLNETDEGLHTVATPLMSLATSVEVVLAVEAGLINEMSFAFMIVRQDWSPDFMQRSIVEIDLNRGDVSAVNYGANPNTSIGMARSFRSAKPAELHRMAVEAREGHLSDSSLQKLAQVLEQLAAVEDVKPADVPAAPADDAAERAQRALLERMRLQHLRDIA